MWKIKKEKKFFLPLRYHLCGIDTVAPWYSSPRVWHAYHGKTWSKHGSGAIVHLPWSNHGWTMVFWVMRSYHGYPVAATSAVRVFAAAWRAAHASSYCWRPRVRSYRSDALEQSAIIIIIYSHDITDCVSLTSTENLFSVSFPWLRFAF